MVADRLNPNNSNKPTSCTPMHHLGPLVECAECGNKSFCVMCMRCSICVANGTTGSMVIPQSVIEGIKADLIATQNAEPNASLLLTVIGTKGQQQRSVQLLIQAISAYVQLEDHFGINGLRTITTHDEDITHLSIDLTVLHKDLTDA